MSLAETGGFGSRTGAEFYKTLSVEQAKSPWFEAGKGASIPQWWQKLWLLPEGDNHTESQVQEWWSELLCTKFPAEFKDQPLPWIAADTHLTRVLGSRKPDVTLYTREQKGTLLGVSSVMELTAYQAGCTTYQFTETKSGQLATFLNRMVLLQPTRDAATGVLSDGLHIQFMRVRREELDKRATVSPVMRMDSKQADEWFWGWIRATPSALGWSLPSVCVGGVSLQLSEWLGEGASSTVWRATIPDRAAPAVVKFHKQRTASDSFDRERETLTRLSARKPLASDSFVFTRLLHVADVESGHSLARALVVEPAGVKFACQPDHFGMLSSPPSRCNTLTSRVWPLQ